MKKLFVFASIIVFVALGIFCSQKLFSKKSKKIPDLTVMGQVRPYDGIGRLSIELIESFKDSLDISFEPTQKVLKDDYKLLSADLKKLVKNPKKRRGKVIFFQDALWRPNSDLYLKLGKIKNSNEIRLAYSMFESTLIPVEWTFILNNYFDAVVVPDEFLIDVYKDSGVTVPIFVLPLAFDIDPLLKRPLKSKKNTPFVFANFSVAFERKNHLTLMRAFAKEFKNDPNVVLWINSKDGGMGYDEKLREEINNLGVDNIKFTRLCLEKDAYIKVFENVDCYVSISKGEGFSIPPREAMALGIPVIATANTGQKVLCDSGLVRSVDSLIHEEAWYYWGESHGHHFNCNEDDVAAALRDVYENYDHYLGNAQESRDWVNRYRYESLKPFFFSLFNPKKIVLGNENTILDNCLITNSRELFDKYLKLTSAKGLSDNEKTK